MKILALVSVLLQAVAQDGHKPHPVTALAASPRAPLIAVALHEAIAIYDTDRSTWVGQFAFPEGIPYVLRFSRDGSQLLAAGGKNVQSGRAVLFDVRSGRRLAVFGSERDSILAADISVDGRLIALGGPDKIIRVYSTGNGQEKYQIAKHTDWILAIEFSPDGTHLATADRSGAIHLWESASGGILISLSGHKDAVTSLSWRRDSLQLVSGSEDGQLIVWKISDGFPVATASKAHTPKLVPNTYGTQRGGILSVQFMLDGRVVSVGRDCVIRLWTSDMKPKGASAQQTALLTKVTASYNDKLVIAGDYNGRVVIWDGENLKTIPPMGRVHESTILRSPSD